MSLYSKYIYPRVIDYLLSGAGIMEYRKGVLSHVRGNILEIGFGTGLNLPCYPPSVKEITVIDKNTGMNSLAQKRLKYSGIKVHLKLLNAETLPFEDNTFDSIVSTFTFCSIENIDAALHEFYRVLKPNGKLIFLEHGLSSDQRISKWQHRINPLYKITSNGCNLNRDIRDIIKRSNFTFDNIEQFYSKDMIKLAGYLYKGVASKGGHSVKNTSKTLRSP
ncbi:MAG: class I SAM-dependent methyltransferase [Clostridia bacterium]|nr:class I SAM-dependent methyltransferase [Clostridia bacterium]